MSEAVPTPRSSWWARGLRDPLVHFLLAGAALFILHALFNRADLGGPPQQITISAGRVAQLQESFRLIANRPPSAQELSALVDDFVREEIAYREAVAIGLDQDDTIIRRRLRQKLEFTMEDISAVDEPTEADLVDWLAAHPDRYQRPERRALMQALASGDRRGADADAAARGFITALAAGADPLGVGDPSLLPRAIPLTTRDGVRAIFGDAFAAAAFEAPAGDWLGPVRSPFGAHAVRIVSVEPPETPPFSDLRDQLREDWIAARRDEMRTAAAERLRSRYQVKIDWPDGLDPAGPQAGAGAAAKAGALQ